MTPLDYDTAEVFRAAEAAVQDAQLSRGGYYAGPATPVYLAVLAALASQSERREENGQRSFRGEQDSDGLRRKAE